MSAVRRRQSDSPSFRGLPALAQAYVGAAEIAGTACVIAAAVNVRLDRAGLFAMLTLLAVATSAVKIELPLGRSQSNPSLSHAVNFWALFALGPAQAVIIATVSA